MFLWIERSMSCNIKKSFHWNNLLFVLAINCPFSFRRNLDYFCTNLQNAVCQTDPCNNGGEVTVRLPSETMPIVEGRVTLSITLSYEMFYILDESVDNNKSNLGETENILIIKWRIY